MKVYLIEDDAGLRQALGRCMERFGFVVIGEAGDGAAALRDLTDPRQGLRPDLIISDCQMPVMDGLSFARRFRGLNPRTPMLMISGQDSDEVVAAAIEAGFNGFLAKPVTARLLAEALQLVLPGFQVAA